MIDDVTAIMGCLICLIVGLLIGWGLNWFNPEIQEIKPVDNGYYITINDEIYYKENGNE